MYTHICKCKNYVETVPGSSWGERSGGGEFKYDVFEIL
jgi:hypothetical protein